MTVTLRPLRADDAAWDYHWAHAVPDAEWKRWDAPYFHDPAATPPTFEDFAAGQRLGSPHQQVIEVDGERVGLLTRWEEEPRGGGWWEVGIVIFDPAYWGGGIGSEALAQWVSRTFTETPAHVVTLTTWGGNERMIRTGLRLGFTECARIPEARVVDGERHDSVKLALLASAAKTTTDA